MAKKIYEACRRLLTICGNCQPEENILIVTDTDSLEIGMDNTYLAEMLSPQLTTVDFSKEEFSERLVDTMLKLMKGEQPEDTFISVSLSVREST